MRHPRQVALWGSGSGTTIEAIIRATLSGEIRNVQIARVISTSRKAARKAKQLDIPASLIDPNDYSSDTAFGEALLQLCPPNEIDGIGQHGWMPQTPGNVIVAFPKRMWNQHPGLVDPTWAPLHFGGKGWYGRRPHAGRLFFVRKTKRDYYTAAVCQWVELEFDSGEVFKEERIPIKPHHDPYTLQKEALPVEHRVQISAINDWANDRTQPVKRSGPLVLPGEEPIFAQAFEAAKLLFPQG